MKILLQASFIHCTVSAIMMFIITGHQISDIEKYPDVIHHVANFVKALTWMWFGYICVYTLKREDGY